MKKSRLVLLTAVFVMALLLTIVGGAVNANEVVIGVSPKMKGAPYWEAAEKGAIKAGEDLNIKVVVQAPTTADATQQATIIDNLITMGVDALVVSANDETALLPVLERAASQGIIIVTYDSDVPDSPRKYMVHAADTITIGRKMGELLVEEMGESGEVAIMTGGLGALNLNQHIKGAEEVLAKYPDIQIVKVAASGDDQGQAFINAENLLRSYPDLKGIIGVAAGEPPAAAEAIEQAGKAGEVAIVGLITPNSVKKYFHNGTMKKGLLWDPAELTYVAVKVAYELLNDQEPKDGEVLYPGGTPIKVEPPFVYVGTTVFTPENIDNYDF